jgi:hypothetical protein
MAAAGTTKIRWQWIGVLAVGAIALLPVLWRGLPMLLARRREAMERRKQTEAYAFRRLTSDLGSGDNAEAYRALLHWAERLQPRMSARTFASRYGDKDLSAAIAALSAAVYGDVGAAFDAGQFRTQLSAARRRYFARDAGVHGLHLPPLNP